MLNLLRAPRTRSLSLALRYALKPGDLPPGTDVSALGVAEAPGTYGRRPVTYFRLFDPECAAASGIRVSSREAYDDLSKNLDLVLRAGFFERDGTVVVFSDHPGCNLLHPGMKGPC
jgi:hypothetical protein